MTQSQEFIHRKMIEERLADIVKDWFNGNDVQENDKLVIETKIYKSGENQEYPTSRFTHIID